jgi:hypothetical protein
MPTTHSPRIKAHSMPSVEFHRNLPIGILTSVRTHLHASAHLFAQMLHLRSVMDKRLLISTLLCSTLLLSNISVFAGNSSKGERWYRYYDNGIPTLSSSVSEQHMSHGYDILDNHMQVIQHIPPFSTIKYDQQKVQREQAIEKQIADRHLIETYTSSDRAILQRDRELSELDNQI